MTFFNTNSGGSSGNSHSYIDNDLNFSKINSNNFEVGDEIVFDTIPKTCTGPNRVASIESQCGCQTGFIDLGALDCEKCWNPECKVCTGESGSSFSAPQEVSGQGFYSQQNIESGKTITINVVNYSTFICMGIIDSTVSGGSNTNSASICSDDTITNYYGSQTYTGQIEPGSYFKRKFLLKFTGTHLEITELGKSTNISMDIDTNLTYKTFVYSDATIQVKIGEEPVQTCTDCYGDKSQIYSRDSQTCTCPSGYYSDLPNSENCQQCSFEGCVECYNRLECVQCKGIQTGEQKRGINIITGKNECVCPEHYTSIFSIQDDCLPNSCLSTCLTCDTVTECTVCKGSLNQPFSRGINYQNNKMECICPPNYYALSDTEDCYPCGFEGCDTCENKTVCLTCLGSSGQPNSRIINPTTNVNECICPVGYYSDLPTNDDCQQCLDTCEFCIKGDECAQCKGTQDLIFSRIKNRYNQKNECLCPAGYYSDLNIQDDCIACTDNFEGCKTCENNTSCTSCLGDPDMPYSRIVNPLNNKNECICPNRYRSNLPTEENCVQCPFEGCKTCDQNICLSCIGQSGVTFSRTVNGSGILECICPQGYYSNASAQEDCLKCLEGCISCTTGSECIGSCKGDAGQVYSRGINSSGVLDCSCPDGYYSDISISNNCIQCSFEGCQSCSNNLTCSVCKGESGQVFSRTINPSNNQNECVCPKNYRSNLPTEENCVQCTLESCYTCNQTQCLTCRGQESQVFSRIGSDCVCPQGYYSDFAVQEDCIQCLEGCIACVNGTECSGNCKGTLNQAHSRVNTNCVCPTGYYSDITTQDDCILCNQFEGCLTCDNALSCLTCKGDANQAYSRGVNPLTNINECVCPKNYLSNLPTEQNCVQCLFEGCLTCDSSQCLTCRGQIGQAMSRTGSQCTCPTGYYSDLGVSDDCIKCLDGCSQCVNGSECVGDCAGTLNQAHSRINTNCSCPEGYYSNVAVQVDCIVCTNNFEGCKTCNLNSCITCIGTLGQSFSRIANPINQNNECVCPYNYYSSTNVQEDCIQCNFQGCKTCQDSIQCQTCFGNTGQANSRIAGPNGINECICPDFYYSDTSVQEDCIQCQFDGCKTCNNALECLVCKGTTGQVFSRIVNPNNSKNECICPDGYYSDITLQEDCFQCAFDTCLTCNEISQCLICIGTLNQPQSRVINPQNSKNECVCPKNYYSDLTIQNDCIQCAFEGCQTCTDQIDCSVCLGEPNLPNSRIPNLDSGLNECICPRNYYSDVTVSDYCIKCVNDGCFSCENTTECLVCIGQLNQPYSRIINPLTNLNECICPDGYYSNISVQDDCLLCVDNFIGCKLCVNNYECTECIGDTGLPNSRVPNPDTQKNECVCPYKYYSDVSIQDNCLACPFDACLVCLDNVQCTVCVGDQDQPYSRIVNPNTNLLECICPIGYISDLTIQDNCIQCEFQCAECELQTHNCTVCIGVRDLEIGCNCLRGFYDDKVNPECLPCESGCDHCDKDKCIECIGNKYNPNPGFSKTCDCYGPNYLDHTGISEYCTNCDSIVIKKIQFSDDFLNVIIEFYDEIIIRNPLYDVYSFTKEFCIELFEIESQESVGMGSLCSLDMTNKIITVEIGTNPTITQNDEIIFKQGFIQRQVCPDTDFINNFYENIIQQASNPVLPIAKFTRLSETISVCENIQINNNQIENDGNRGLFNITWALEYTTSGDTQQIDELLEKVNLKSQSYLLIPALTLTVDSDYTFRVSYENIGFQIGFTKFQFSTLEFRKGIAASVIQTRPFIFRNYQKNNIESVVNFLDCQGGSFTTVQQSLNVTWYDETDDPDNPQYIDSVITEPDQQVAVYNMEQYSQIPGKTYYFKAKIKSPTEAVEQNIYFMYQIIQSNLIATIEGGNRLQSYTETMYLNGKGYDPDIIPELQEQDIEHSWSCKDLGKVQPCETIVGDLLVFNQTNHATFQKRLFQPYSSLEFSYHIIKTDKLPTKTKAVLVIVESELPQLVVTVPQSFETQKININDDLQIVIDTENDPDEVFFSIVFLYDLDIVATKSFNYNIMAFKIWDIYSDFNTQDNELQIRVSMYNPQFFMPSQSNYNIILNFEPQGGELIITPLSGYAMDTDFTILLDGFRDDNLPLSYKYQYYQLSDYYLDIQEGDTKIKSLKNIISDFTQINQITTKLPQGNLVDDGELGQANLLLIMVTVSDSLGAIRNVTQTVNVQPNTENFQKILNNYQQGLNNLKKQQIDQQVNYLTLLTKEITNLGLDNCQNNCSGDGECVQEDEMNYCVCDEGFYLQDCSQNQGQEKYTRILQELYSLLQIYSEKVSSQAIQGQIQQSINSIQNNKELNDIIEQQNLESNIKLQNKMIKEQKKILENIFDTGLLFQGDNIISNKYKQVTENLSKSLQNADSIHKNLKSLKKKRILSQEEYVNLQEQAIEISNNSTSLLQEAQIPNSDPLTYKGSDLQLIAQKLTFKKLENQYFKYEEKYLEQNLNEQIDVQDTLDGESDGEQDGEIDGEQSIPLLNESSIYTSSQNNYKNNPFKDETEFPYPDQDLGMIDLIVKNLEFDQAVEELDNPINIRFDQVTNSTRLKCITRNRKTKEWKNEYCQPSEKEGENGQTQINCSCKSIVPVTVIDDINNVFEDSLIEEVFSDQGLNSLIQLKFWELYMFYILVFKTIFLIGAMIQGYRLDNPKKQKIKQEKQEVNVLIKQMNSKGEYTIKQVSPTTSKNQDIESKKQNSQNIIQEEEITSKSSKINTQVNFNNTQSLNNIEQINNDSEQTINKKQRTRQIKQSLQEQSKIRLQMQEEEQMKEQEKKEFFKFQEEQQKLALQRKERRLQKKEQQEINKKFLAQKKEKLPEESLQQINSNFTKYGMDALNQIHKTSTVEPIIEEDQETIDQNKQDFQQQSSNETSSIYSKSSQSQTNQESIESKNNQQENNIQIKQNLDKSQKLDNSLQNSTRNNSVNNNIEQCDNNQKQDQVIINISNENSNKSHSNNLNNDESNQINIIANDIDYTDKHSIQNTKNLFDLQNTTCNIQENDVNSIENSKNSNSIDNNKDNKYDKNDQKNVKNDIDQDQKQIQNSQNDIIQSNQKDDIQQKIDLQEQNSINSCIKDDDLKNARQNHNKKNNEYNQDNNDSNSSNKCNKDDTKQDNQNQDNSDDKNNIDNQNSIDGKQYQSDKSKSIHTQDAVSQQEYSKNNSNNNSDKLTNIFEQENSLNSKDEKQIKEIQQKEQEPIEKQKVKSKVRKGLLIAEPEPEPKKSFFSIFKKKKQEEKKNKNLSKINQMILEEIEQEEIKENINKNPAFQKPIEEEKIKHVSQGIIQFHEFFSIFYIQDEKINRPVRFAIYYLKITLLIAISGLFSQNTTFIQSIILSIVSSILLIIPMNLIVVMYKSKRKNLKILSIILLILIQLLVIFTILTTAAVMGVEKSNQWVEAYAYTFMTNFCIIVPLQIAIILNIIKYSMVKGKKFFFIDEQNQSKMIEFLYPNYQK